MKFWSSLPLIIAIALFGTTLASCGDSADTGPAAEEEVADEDDADEEDGEEESADEEVADEEDGEDESDLYTADFTLVNDTSRTLLEFYVSAPEEENWGEDVFGENLVLGPGESATVTITDAREGCDYDVLGVLDAAEDGSVGEGELIQSGVDICDGATYTYSEE
ncbi:MAG: hypothetical protein F6J87_15740 [Spirulina sp. SIO3F2]|nr:hypothetical protein [Spirulina sp. SIO3F2]